MRKFALILISAAAALSAAAADSDAKTIFVGNFENPTESMRNPGGDTWWERAPFQWYTIYSGSQAIYSADLLTGLEPGDLIREVSFKYGDDGSFVELEADLTVCIENCNLDEFEQRVGSTDYAWADFDMVNSATLAYSTTLYDMDNQVITFVLDEPLEYTGANLLVTAYSERTSADDVQAVFTYGIRTDRYTTMSTGDDRESFLDCYETGMQHAYHSPSKYVPVLRLDCTEAQGVADVAADLPCDGPATFFDLRGARVSAQSLAPGIYLRRSGNSVQKVFVK